MKNAELQAKVVALNEHISKAIKSGGVKIIIVDSALVEEALGITGEGYLVKNILAEGMATILTGGEQASTFLELPERPTGFKTSGTAVKVAKNLREWIEIKQK